MMWLLLCLSAITICAVCLLAWRISDLPAERKLHGELLALAGSAGGNFDPAVLEHLPEPAQRFFRFTIAPGTPLVSAVEIEMYGQIGLGTKEEPAYRPMTASQILAPPYGLLWRLRCGAISGSDAAAPATSWTRFWLFHLIPVARVSDNADHHRSAFGRVVAEAAFWVPSSLLPGTGVTWEPIDENTARAIVSYQALSQAIDLSVDADGRPIRVVMQRWSNENADRVFREQPFGGYLSEFREIAGYRLPMRVEGGNLIGTPDYFPFYQAEVTSIRFPQLSGQQTGDAGDLSRNLIR